VVTAAAASPGAALADRGQELGLAVAVVPPAGPDSVAPWELHRSAGSPVSGPLRVVDLSALWAGPLCAQLLAAGGSDVVTVDSVGRPDGARTGDPALFSLLHRHTRSCSVDLRTTDGRAVLRSLVDEADVVITSARPRALQQLGLDPLAEAAARPGLTWVAVTGYGLTGPGRDRVAYGDDAAAAGGLVVGDPPVFCADAAGDPATGLYAALAAVALARSGGGVVDVALSQVARHLARGPHRAAGPDALRTPDGWAIETAEGLVPVARPRARS
jgi:crotonobetainyl-CoA:carnitine CoA-transferase CaiB-like acyl-CoA transferase